ncbi:MAG: TonB-dependent receptor [Xanthomonadales bacterium]|nr:TonB-dependent receptor [Xanthomonadales bacterium]
MSAPVFPEAGREDREVEHVTVTAKRRAATQFDVSAAVTVVSEEDIQAENPDVLAEMLRGLPGTWFQQTTPGQGIPIIRGLKGSQVLHLVDGMRLNNAFFRSAPNQYLGLVDPFATASVEVVRGAAGTLYGADAMGGVLNVLTAEPDLTGTAANTRGRFYAAYGSADRGWSARSEVSHTANGNGILLGASYQDRGDRENGNGVRLIPSGFRAKSADAKWLTEPGERSELMLSAQFFEQPSTPRTDELVPGFGQQQPSSAEFEFMPNRRSFLHARFRLQGDGGWLDDLEIHAARQVIDDDRRTRDFGSAERTEEQNRSTLDGLTVQFNSEHGNGTMLTWGLEYYADEVRSSRTRQNLETGVRQGVTSRFPDGASMDSAAAYLSADWEPHPRLDLSAGLRYSHFNIWLPAGNEVPETRLTPADLSGDIHAVWALGENTHLVANIGRGFRPPNIFDLGTLGPRPGNRFNVANPNLDPEYVWSYDLGIKVESGDWRSELFVFLMDYQDKITSVFTGEVTESGRTVVRSENRNDVELYGLEAGFEWTASPRGTLSGALNYTRGDESDGAGGTEPADRTPPLNGRLEYTWRVNDRLRIAADLTFAAKQDRLSSRDVDDPRIDPEGSAGWSSIGIRADWQYSETARFGVSVENLADRHYREHASGIDAPGLNLGLWWSAEF